VANYAIHVRMPAPVCVRECEHSSPFPPFSRTLRSCERNNEGRILLMVRPTRDSAEDVCRPDVSIIQRDPSNLVHSHTIVIIIILRKIQ